MSISQRRILGYWLLMLAGLTLIAMQIVKYWNGTLELKLEEFIVTIMAVSLVIAPKIILESIEKFMNSKYGNKNES